MGFGYIAIGTAATQMFTCEQLAKAGGRLRHQGQHAPAVPITRWEERHWCADRSLHCRSPNAADPIAIWLLKKRALFVQQISNLSEVVIMAALQRNSPGLVAGSPPPATLVVADTTASPPDLT